MRQPVGKCRYCGQEFMRKQTLERHEAVTCQFLPETDTEAPPEPEKRPRWRQVTQAGDAIGWIRQ